MKTRADVIAERTYNDLRDREPGLFPLPWADVPENWKCALAFTALAGSEHAADLLLKELRLQPEIIANLKRLSRAAEPTHAGPERQQ